MYNLLIAWWQDAYKDYKLNGTPIPKRPDYTVFRNMDEYSYFKKCDSVALQQARMHFDNAIENFFKSRKGNRKGRKSGFPTFKKKGVSKDSYTTFNNAGTIKLSEDKKTIRLPKVGNVRIKLHREFIGEIKTVNVSCSRSGNYYVSVTVDSKEYDKPLLRRVEHAANPSVVGLDMSMSEFVVSSEKTDVTKPKYVRLYRKNERKLARLQREMSRKKSGSKNRDKARMKYARFVEHVANQRREYLIQTALYYVRKYDVVCLEDIDMQGMSRTLNLGKSVLDLGFGEFRRWLDWEGWKYDSYIHYVDKWYASSKTCNKCGYKNTALKLSDREWVCPVCGEAHDRDVNAAKNLRDDFLRKYNTAGTAGINACGDKANTLRETVGRALSSKQEAAELIKR